MAEDKPKKKPGPKSGKRSAKTEVFSTRCTPKQKIALQKVFEAMNEAVSDPPTTE